MDRAFECVIVINITPYHSINWYNIVSIRLPFSHSFSRFSEKLKQEKNERTKEKFIRRYKYASFVVVVVKFAQKMCC